MENKENINELGHNTDLEGGGADLSTVNNSTHHRRIALKTRKDLVKSIAVVEHQIDLEKAKLKGLKEKLKSINRLLYKNCVLPQKKDTLNSPK